MKKFLTLLIAVLPLAGHVARAQTEGLQYSLTERWPANAWHGYQKASYTYDNAGRTTAILYETYTVTDTWRNSTHESYVYDPQGRRTEITVRSWDTVGGTWKNSAHFLYTFAGNNTQPETYTYQVWANNAWTNNGRQLYTYGSTSVTTIQEWENNAWVNQTRHSNTQNGSGAITGSLVETWSGSTWENYERSTNTLNTDNQTTHTLRQTWNAGAWANASQTDYTYSGNQLLQYTAQSWVTGAWVNTTRTTNTYTSWGGTETYLYEKWENNAWLNYLKYEYTYDTDHRNSKRKELHWDVAQAAWQNASQTDYTYTPGGKRYQDTQQLWDIPSPAWKNVQRITYYYLADAAMEEADAPGLSLYPNPATDYITLRTEHYMGARLIVYDMAGHTMCQTEANTAETRINTEHLPAGLYILELTHGPTKRLHKFIKQ